MLSQRVAMAPMVLRVKRRHGEGHRDHEAYHELIRSPQILRRKKRDAGNFRASS